MSDIQVIGGSGFIGTRLCHFLKESSKSFNILDVKSSSSFPDFVSNADVRDFNQLLNALEDSDCIVNLAAEHRDDVWPLSLYDDVNVNGAKNICKAAEEKKITKIVFTSSVAVYGFAPADTGENGAINPFNDYGRTKYEAERVFIEWQKKDPNRRMLSIIRPTVVFGEGNRGNVYNLLRQISSGRFMMIGTGNNKKSMAYVDNVAAFIKHSMSFEPGIHIYNYVDKPDLTMSSLVSIINRFIKGKDGMALRIPYFIGLLGGAAFDVLSKISGRKFPISYIRVKKFCATTQFSSSVATTGFVPPCSLQNGLQKTLSAEFIE